MSDLTHHQPLKIAIRWHNGDYKLRPISEFFGMTEEEYACWERDHLVSKDGDEEMTFIFGPSSHGSYAFDPAGTDDAAHRPSVTGWAAWFESGDEIV